MSLFITFEGGEGTGKSTQIDLLGAALNQRQYTTLKTREPGGTAFGLKIRELLLKGKPGDLAPEAEMLLYVADRAQHIREVVKPALSAEKVVLCDRFADATWVYQGYARGLDIPTLESLNRLASLNLIPDLTLLLDLPPEVGLARSKHRLAQEQSKEDRFEQESLEFHQKVREGYLKLAAANPQRFAVFDANEAIETLHQKILDTVLERLES